MESDPDVALATRLTGTSASAPVADVFALTPPSSDERVLTLLLQQVDHLARSDPAQALRVAQRALEVCNYSPSVGPALRAGCLRALGHACRALGHYSQCLGLYDQAAHIYRAAGLPVEAARTHLGTIDALMYLGRPAEALALGRRLRRTFVYHGEMLNLAKLEINLSIIQARLHRSPRALALADSAAARLVSLGEHLLLAQVNVNRANILTNMGNFRHALDAYMQARATFAAHNMHSWTAKIDVNIGYLYAAQGHYNRALSTISAACRVFADLHSPRDLATANLDLAEVYLALNLDREAERLAAEAVDTFTHEGMTHDMARALLLQAHALAATTEEPSAALALLERAAAAFSTEGYAIGVAVVSLHQAALLLNGEPRRTLELVAAAEPMLAAQRLVAQHGQSLLLKATAHEKLGACRAARAAFKRAQRAGARYGQPWLLAQACHGEGRLRERRDPAGARQAYEDAIDAIESMRAELQPDELRISFVRGRLGPYEDLLRLLLRSNDAGDREAAFAVVERARSRALLDLLAGNLDVAGGAHTPPADPVQADLQERIAHLREELNWHLSIIHNWHDDAHQRRSLLGRRQALQSARAIEDELHRLMRQWRLLNPTDASPQTARAVDIPTIQAQLAPRQALIEYAIVDDEVLAFVVGPDSVTLVRHLCSAAEVGRLIDRLHAGLQRFGYGETWAARYSVELQRTTDHHLARLGDALLGPLIEALAGYDRLVIAPHGPLHYMPFHALHTPRGSLIDTHEMVVAPSASVWVICQQRVRTSAPASAPNVLVLGVDDSQTPWMLHEAESVGRLFNGAQVFTGPDASVAALNRDGGTCDVLHLACHGLFRGDDPLFSALRLADGWLTVHDIFNLRLRARLVTLSGCQTGRQSIGPGDDLVGLARGFFSAGASQLVVSLWMVNDASTSMLMEHFYRELGRGQCVATALRAAQRALREHYQHPYYWAPFVAIGAA